MKNINSVNNFKKILLMLKDIILNILIHDAKNLLSAIIYEIILTKNLYYLLMFFYKVNFYFITY